MTRYVGTGRGEWLPAGPSSPGLLGWYRYVPSGNDYAIAEDIAERIAELRQGDHKNPLSQRVGWHRRGLLGEIAALHPLGSGPEVDVWTGGFYGRADYGRNVDIRTTSTFQLRGGSPRYPGLGGWRVTAKDRGRIIVCVQDRDEDLVVMGWDKADEVPRLAIPNGPIIAVIEADELRLLVDLAPYAEASKR